MFDWLFPGINRKLDQIMANLEGLTTAVNSNVAATSALVGTVRNAVTELRRLGDLIRNDEDVPQEDIDNLADLLDNSTAEATATSEELQAAVDEDETPPV